MSETHDPKKQTTQPEEKNPQAPVQDEATRPTSTPAHIGTQPEGNGATGKPASFPPHN